MTDNTNTPEPTDDMIDAMLDKIETLVLSALVDHPQRARAVEMIESGAHVFCTRDDARVEFFIGWFEDSRRRPPDADPMETVKLLRVPRQVLVGASNPSDS